MRTLAKSFVLLVASMLVAPVSWAACNKANSISPTSITTSSGVAFSGVLTATGDTGPYEIKTTPKTAPAHGTLVISADGSFTYTPSSGYSGSDSFKVTSVPTCSSSKTKDFTINVTVAACSTPITMSTVPAQSVVAGNTLTWAPSGALATWSGSGSLTYSATINTTSTSAGSLTLNTSTGGFTYISDASFTGPYSFTIHAKNGSCTASQDVAVEVTAPSVCAAPNLPNSSFTTPANADYTLTPTISGGTAPYTYTIVTAPAHGALADNGDGTFTYTPDTDYTGSDVISLGAASTCGSNPSTNNTISVTVGGTTSYCSAPHVSNLALTVPSGVGNITAAPTVSGGTTPYVYSIATTSPSTPLHGSVTINSSTGVLSYTPTSGYAGNDHFTLNVASTCGSNPSTSIVVSVVTESTNSTGSIGATTGSIVSSGAIIIDNTPNPGTPGIVTNMSTVVGGKNFGIGNSFNLDGIQVMQRDNTTTPHRLIDEAGVTNTNSTSYQNYGTRQQTTYFANGQHLFDLDRMRKTANWMRVPSSITVPDASTLNSTVGTNQIAPTTTPPASCTAYTTLTATPNSPSTPIGLPVGSCHPAGTYGTITWAEFLDNIKNNRTMYGVVRILVPLQLGKAASSNNALNQSVGTSKIYGFCAAGAGEWCADSPTKSTDVKPGATVAGNNSVAVAIPATGQIKVRGTLMFDFVNGTTDAELGAPGHPIGLDRLPFNPRDIYFKVSVPINVNAANDLNGDGILDNIDYINGISKNITCPSYPCSTVIPANGTGNSPAISNLQVPQDSIDAYNFQYGTNFTSNVDPAFITKFNALNVPSQYHMLMASGYVQGWADAFSELNITAQQWKDLGYVVPSDATLNAPLTLSNLRSNAFEDIPVYLYTGGLVDMHHHMNVSGLIYVPQAAEIEAKMNDAAHPTRMYMMGGLIVRDGFFLEGKSGSVTLITSDPQSFSSLRVLSSAIQGAVLTSALSTVHDSGSGSSSPYGVGLSGGGGSGGGSSASEQCVGCGGSATAVAKTRWIEIRPR